MIIDLRIYGLLLFLYLFLQFLFASLERIKQKKNRKKLGTYSFVTIIVPFYNESIEELLDTLKAISKLNYHKNKYECIVIDDGSKSDRTFISVKRRYEYVKNFKFIRNENNKGKREVQVDAFRFRNKESEYLLMVDSDSVLDENSLYECVRLAKNFNVSAVTGTVLAKQQKDFLNKLLRIRYWIATLQERLSQSYFDQVMCCSGPCTLWEVKTFLKIKDRYISQSFLKKKCTYGDDRHLTNLFLLENKKIKTCPNAFAYTSTPTSLKVWIKQQIRWSKSFYRECYWSFKNLNIKMGWYLIYQNLMVFVLPFLLLGNFFSTLFSEHFSLFVIVKYILCIMFAGMLRGIYAFYYSREYTFFLTPIYGFIHLMIVIPIRIYAFFKLKDTKWGTR